MARRIWVLVAGLVLIAGIALAQASLDNEAIIKMTKAGLSEDVIVSMVNGQTGKYDITADAVIKLKQAGATDRVINAMVAKASGVPVPTAAHKSN